MNQSKYSSRLRSRFAALIVIAGGTLGVLAACSSDDNAAPSTPVINIAGNGGRNSSAGDSGAAGSSPEQGGNANSNGGTGPSAGAGEAGQGGAAGGSAAGEGPVGPIVTCPSTDVEFLNQPSSSQQSSFDNVKRLGAYTALPALQ